MRYRLERQDRGNRYRWEVLGESDGLRALLDLVPLRRADQHRIVDLKARAARRVGMLLGADATEWRSKKNRTIRTRERHEQC